MNLPLPPPQKFSAAGRLYLDSFYSGHSVTTSEEKCLALRSHLIKEDTLVTGVDGTDEELLALEYYCLLTAGFQE